MNYRLILLLIIIVTANDMRAARSSSSNFKSLQQREIEKAEAAKAAQKAAAEAARHPDGAHLSQATEKIIFIGPKAGWGFVKKMCAHYSPEGKNLGELKAGTLFKYRDVKSTSKSDMLLASLRDGSGWHGSYLLPCSEVAAYEGDPETVDIQIVEDLRTYFLLKGEHDQYREELLTREYKKNPYYAAYQQASDQYTQSVEKANQLTDDLEQLSGISKTRAYGELRKLKYSQSKLKVNLQQIGADYKAWKQQHPIDPDLIQDEKICSLQRRIDEVKRRVANLIPPEE